jgi:hypothetical protein
MQKPEYPKSMIGRKVFGLSGVAGTIEKLGSLDETPFVLWSGNSKAISAKWEDLTIG